MRLRAGLTQEEMAERMNMSRCNISKLENGRLEIRGTDLIRWVRETNAHEFFAALICNFDPVLISNMISNLVQLIGG